MTDAQRRIIERLQEKWSDSTCPRCGHDISTISHQFLLGPRLPQFAWTTCQECGHVDVVDVTALNLPKYGLPQFAADPNDLEHQRLMSEMRRKFWLNIVRSVAAVVMVAVLALAEVLFPMLVVAGVVIMVMGVIVAF